MPEGPLTMTGALLKAELSLTRRGTHKLLQRGRDVVYVESNALNLREFENLDVVIHGSLERNTDPSDLPVLIADAVVLVQIPSRRIDVPALHVSFAVPREWSATHFDDGIAFSQTGALSPLLRVSRSAFTVLPSGARMLVGGRSAVRVSQAGGDAVFVQSGRDMIVFSFATQDSARILASVQFTASSSTTSATASAGTGSGSVLKGAACGGAAGILCPSGHYCEVTDQAAGIGVCIPIRGLP